MVFLIFVHRALADTAATLVGADLQPRRVALRTIDNGSVSFFDAQRRLANEPLNHFVQVRDIASPPPPRVAKENTEAPAVVELVDGQRFVGRWVAAGKDGSSFEWSHSLLGHLTISLDNLQAMTLAGSPLEASEKGADRVRLGNGDLVEGFVSRVTDAGVELKTTGAAQAITLPFERIKALRFANAASRNDKIKQPMVWLSDGSRVLASALSLADDRLKVQSSLVVKAANAPLDSFITLVMSSVSRIDLATSAGELMPLAGLKPGTVSGGDVFGVPTLPRVEGQDVLLHAPVVVGYALPLGTRRFAAQAKLDIADVNAKAWADFEVVARVDNKEAGRWHISGQGPSAAINIAAEGATLTLELIPGVNGPILDRLRLVEPVLLVRANK